MWTTIVAVEALAKRLGDPDLRILDCRHQLTNPGWGPDQHRAGHIPGALHAHVDRDLSAPPRPTTGRHPLPDPAVFRATCSQWGIDQDVQVVAYDDQGGIWAARLWWLLKDYGHDGAAVLDGGLPAWKNAGLPVETASPSVAPRSFEGKPGHRPRVEADEILRGLPGGRHRLLDARAAERYRGEIEPIDPVAGHIPGASSLPAVSLLGPDLKLLPPTELRKRFQSAIGDADPSTLTAYCGSGVTGSHLVLAADVAGLGAIRLYPGSWSEWIRDPKRPIAKGGEPKAAANRV